MSRALYTAATGMHAQQLKMDVTANNLANVNTTGFKRTRAEFEDLMYQTLKTAGARSSKETAAPAGLEVGLGVKPVATARSFEQGELQNTGGQLDVAIQGSGFFQVDLPDGRGMAYTRNGALKVNNDGLLVTSEGYPLRPNISIPHGSEVTIGHDGTITARIPDQEGIVTLGQIELASFTNPGALEATGGGLYRLTDLAAVETGPPGSNGMGSLQQGFLEGSNVRVVEEMITMIIGQRAYEANSKVISTADRMLEETNRLR